MKLASVAVAALLSGVAVSNASAALTFSNISITGAAAGTPTVTTSPFAIDIAFASNAATIGDPTGTFGSTVINIVYDVASDSGAVVASVLSMLGAQVGSGQVSLQTQVFVLPGPGAQVANNNLTFNQANPPPVFNNIAFSQGVVNFRVNQTITLSASDGPDIDLAQLGLLEHTFTVPAPGALALLGLGGLTIARRRR